MLKVILVYNSKQKHPNSGQRMIGLSARMMREDEVERMFIRTTNNNVIVDLRQFTGPGKLQLVKEELL